MKKLKHWFKKYFIPHEGNNHQPHFLRHQSMVVFFLVVLVIEFGFLVQVFVINNHTDFLASVLPGALTNLTNQERAQNDVPPLTENALLDKAAQMKANDMATIGYFAHTSPEGKTPWYWFDQVGYNYTMAGENLAVNFFESSDVANAWMNSPTHRANIVKADYKEIGIGVASGTYQGRDTVFVAQLFGTPVFATPEPTTPAPITAQGGTPLKAVATPKPKTVAVNPKVTVAPKVAAVSPTAVRVLGEETATKTTNPVKSFLEQALTSPRTSVAYTYCLIALLVVIALALALFIKSEIRHPAILLRGFAMIAIVFVLLFVNFKVLNLHTEVPTTGQGASVIAY